MSKQLDIIKSYQTILKAARERRFLSYGDLAKANEADWNSVRREIPRHLGELVEIGVKHGWPMLTSIVTNKENIETGKLEGAALDGFIKIAGELDLFSSDDDPLAFVREQQEAVFQWAVTAPDDFPEASNMITKSTSKGPRFVQYFGPVLDALRALGGEATPKDVMKHISNHIHVSEEELHALNKGRQTKFENKIAWARFYLVKAGLVGAKKRGIWSLTSEGQETELDQKASLKIFQNIQAQFKAPENVENEDSSPPDIEAANELFDDPERQFWFVGASWGKDSEDQTGRFLSEGIWENGYDDGTYENLVRQMRPGDRIAIKASFVRKNDLPFDNRNKPVSGMKIKAVGEITQANGDGKTVHVDWRRIDPPKSWYFYTYQKTVWKPDPTNDHARRLILFSFVDIQQDYNYWRNQPYWRERYGPQISASVDPVTAGDDESIGTGIESLPPYGIPEIMKDGCFVEKSELENALLRLNAKKNLILQGPPGTGKTWLAKRLGYAQIGTRDRNMTRRRMRVLQFHPSLSYEDFVRGWRPFGDGKLSLVDGVFLEAIQAAEAEPDLPFVLIIEEINRGNPAQVFGEMLTLLEDSKRQPSEAIELAYRRHEGERIYITENLYLIGTMNIADRSLALVDLALRRRFTFISLDANLNEHWRKWCLDHGLAELDVTLIQNKMNALNKQISEDRSLGAQFKIGHSYVTPNAQIRDGKKWFEQIIRAEISPLLEEYWFDNRDQAESATDKLLAGL